jgi:hypothetical protein
MVILIQLRVGALIHSTGKYKKAKKGELFYTSGRCSRDE